MAKRVAGDPIDAHLWIRDLLYSGQLVSRYIMVGVFGISFIAWL
jgi:hypothetical protein